MEEVISTLHGKITVKEHPDEIITIIRHGSYLPLIFHSRHELWDFFEQLQKIIPNRESSTIDRYVGERGRYDVT